MNYLPNLLRTATQKGYQFALDLVSLIYKNEAISLVGDAAGLLPSAAAGSLYIALHYAEPYSGDTQDSNEASYVGYARSPIARSTASWVRLARQDLAGGIGATSTVPTLASKLPFYLPALQAFSPGDPTGALALITHVSVGAAISGAGLLMYVCTLPAPVQLNTQNVHFIPTLLVSES